MSATGSLGNIRLSEYIRGTKGYSDGKQTIWDAEGNVLYEYERPVDANGESTMTSPYVQEHIDLVTAIRTGEQIVEAEETAKSVLTAIMGREAAYTGKKVSWDEMMGSDQVLGPKGDLAMGPVDMKAIIPVAGSDPK